MEGSGQNHGRPRSLHQSGGGDAFDGILAPGDVSMPPSWRSRRAARVASTEAGDCDLAGDRLLDDPNLVDLNFEISQPWLKHGPVERWPNSGGLGLGYQL